MPKELHSQFIVGAIADDLKTPLMQIAYSAELAKHTKNLDSFDEIEHLARAAMNDIDSLLLGLRSTVGQLELPLLAQAPSASVYDAIVLSSGFLSKHNFLIETEFKSKALAMLNPEGLVAVLRTLIRTLSQVSNGFAKDNKLRLVVSLHANSPTITILSSADVADSLKAMSKKCRANYHKESGGVITGSGPAAGLFVAEQLLKAMKGKINTITTPKQCGFRLTLTPSAQLQIV